MAKFSWKRLTGAVKSVLAPVTWAEDFMGGVLQWLPFAGLSVGLTSLASWQELLPEDLSGKLFWIGTVVLALALGVSAVYRVRSEVSSAGRLARDEARTKALSALKGVTQEFLALHVKPPTESVSPDELAAINRRIDRYGEAVEATHHFEADSHALLLTRLRRVVKQQAPILRNEVYKALVEIMDFMQSQEPLLDELDADERKALFGGVTVTAKGLLDSQGLPGLRVAEPPKSS